MKSISSVVSSLGPPLIGLIGVAVGLVLGNWLNQRSEQRKAERDERTRRRIRGERVANIAAVIDAYWEDRIQAEQQWRKEERQRRARQRERANQSQEGKLDV